MFDKQTLIEVRSVSGSEISNSSRVQTCDKLINSFFDEFVVVFINLVTLNIWIEIFDVEFFIFSSLTRLNCNY